jgi:DNA polymerase I-like protein with 3'-5' exonuclease and polymerase domains
VPRYIFDLETNGFLDVVNVIHSLVLMDADTGEITSCSDRPGYMPIGSGLRMLQHADEIIAHNGIKYDIPVIQKLYPKWTFKGKVTDTLIMSRLFFPNIKDTDFRVRENQLKRGMEPSLPGKRIGSHALEAWGYRLGEMKGDYSEIMKERGLDPWATWNKDMQVYCEQDVRVTAKFYNMMAKKFDIENEWSTALDIEHRFQQAIHAQETHGFRFDVQAAEKLEANLRIQRAKLEDSLFGLFEPWWVGLGTFRPAKPQKRFVESAYGGAMRTVSKDTGDTYQHTQKNGKVVTRKVKVKVEQRGYWETLDPECPFRKAELRVFNPSSRFHIEDRLRKLYGWKPTEFTPSGQAKIDDEVLNGLPYEPAKALSEYFMLDKRLGQLADGKQAWLKQVKGGRIYGRVNTLGAITGRCTHSHPNVAQVPSIQNAKGVVPYGAECRALFVPDDGHVLVGCDASGLELRCLAHFMKDGGRYAKIILEGKKEDGTDIHTMNQKAAKLPSRDNAKAFIYAFLYGAGNEMIGYIVGGGAKEGGALKIQFLKSTPGLKGLINAVKAAAKKNGWVRGIDGRRVHVRHQHAALNTLLQNAGAVAMKLATALVYERMIELGHPHGKDWALVANVHDEFQITVHPDLVETVSEVAEWAIAEAGRQLGFTCPLEGEAQQGESWCQTH